MLLLGLDSVDPRQLLSDFEKSFIGD